jgi:Putative RNA methylase family UPF0020
MSETRFPKGWTPSARDAQGLLVELATDAEASGEIQDALCRMGEHYQPWLVRVAPKLEHHVLTAGIRLLSRIAPRHQSSGALATKAAEQGRSRVLFLAECAARDDVRLRRECIVQLGRTGESEAAEAVLLNLWEAHQSAANGLRPEQREAEITALFDALGKCGGARAATVLAEAKGQARSEQVRKEALLRATRNASRDASRNASGNVDVRETQDSIEMQDATNDRLVTHLAALLGRRVQLRCRADLAPLLSRELSLLEASADAKHVHHAEKRGVAADALIVSGQLVEVTLRPEHLESRIATTFEVSIRERRERSNDDKRDPLQSSVPLAEQVKLAFEKAPRTLEATTPLRYRIKVVGTAERAPKYLVRAFAEALDGQGKQALINDPKSAPWELLLHVQNGPLLWRFTPKAHMRFSADRDRVAAATAYPLAAAMVLLSEVSADDVVWDPFAGSGTELLERQRLPHKRLIATDYEEKALSHLREQLGKDAHCTILRHDVRARLPETLQNSVTTVLTNPPMGRRVRTPDLEGLLLVTLQRTRDALAPGGKLVWITPLPETTGPFAETLGFRCLERFRLDMGGFEAVLEKWKLT